MSDERGKITDKFRRPSFHLDSGLIWKIIAGVASLLLALAIYTYQGELAAIRADVASLEDWKKRHESKREEMANQIAVIVASLDDAKEDRRYFRERIDEIVRILSQEHGR